MNADNIKFRCSSLGLIMSNGTDKKSMGDTCKSHLIDVFVSSKYNRECEISAKFLEKGCATEADSITIVSRITKTFLKKNEIRLSNDFITGEPDIFTGESIFNADAIRDAKSSWDAFSFFRAKPKPLDKKYWYQLQGYGWLTGAKILSVDYCLNNTPFHLIEAEIRKEAYNYPDRRVPGWIIMQIISNHVYDRATFEDYVNSWAIDIGFDDKTEKVFDSFVEIPLNERHFNFEFERDDDEIERIEKRVIECRKWMNDNLFKI